MNAASIRRRLDRLAEAEGRAPCPGCRSRLLPGGGLRYAIHATVLNDEPAPPRPANCARPDACGFVVIEIVEEIVVAKGAEPIAAGPRKEG
jgi:hypothetical protein